MRPSVRIIALTSLFLVAPFVHASAQAGQIGITPISGLRQEWFGGVASPNDRFFLLSNETEVSTYEPSRKLWRGLVKREEDAGRFQWSPDGRFIAYDGHADGLPGRYVWILPVDPVTSSTRAPARRISTMQGLRPVWSPDSRKVAFIGQDSLHFLVVVAPFNGGDEHVVFRAPGSGNFPVWSRDGHSIFANYTPAGAVPRLIRIAIASGHADSLRALPGAIIGESGDGKLMATSRPAELLISNAADGKMINDIRVPLGLEIVGWSRSSPRDLIALQHVVPSSVQRVTLANGKIETVIPVDSASLASPAFSPDGKSIAYVSRRDGGRLMIAGADGSHLHSIGGHADIYGSMFALSWSASGRLIAYGSRDLQGSRIVDVASGRNGEAVPEARATPNGQFAWRDDGMALRYLTTPLATDASRREVREVTVDGKDRLLTTLSMEGFTRATFVNDTLVALTGSKEIRGVSLSSGAVRAIYTGSVRSSPGGYLGVSRDGAWIAFSVKEGENEAPRIVSLRTGESRRIPYPIGGEIIAVAFHPNGRDLIVHACPTCNAGHEKWENILVPMNGDPPTILTAPASEFVDFGPPSISPDGRAIIFEAEHAYDTRIVRLTLPKS